MTFILKSFSRRVALGVSSFEAKSNKETCGILKTSTFIIAPAFLEMGCEL